MKYLCVLFTTSYCTGGTEERLSKHGQIKPPPSCRNSTNSSSPPCRQSASRGGDRIFAVFLSVISILSPSQPTPQLKEVLVPILLTGAKKRTFFRNCACVTTVTTVRTVTSVTTTAVEWQARLVLRADCHRRLFCRGRKWRGGDGGDGD
jgi:hypothetical protein